MKIKSLKYSVALHLIIIALLGLFAYSNTFDVPFHFDDISKIVENPAIKNLECFIAPSKADIFQFNDHRFEFHGLRNRLVGYFTFALNYRLHGLDLAGYHITNLAIHIVNAFFVYVMVVLTFRTPRMETSALAPRSRYIALLSALLFVSHPVQTQAVTYIVQRFASLATCFYLVSLACYIISRLSVRTMPQRVYYVLALLSAVLAMKTKEMAFTLPLAIALYEVMFFKGTLSKRFVRLVPLLLTMLIIPLSLLSFDMPAGEIMEDIGDKTTVQDMSRIDYLLTEFRVIVTYIRLLFLPINQNLDYDYPVYHSFFAPPVFLSFLLLLALCALGVYLYYASRIVNHESRFIAFGIFWFFITLSMESTLVPLHVIYEHRVYLPSAGASWAISTGAFLLLGGLKGKNVKAFAVSSFILLPLVLSYAAYERNNVWKTELSLWEDVIKKSPKKARAHNNLGMAYEAEGLTDKAIKQYLLAIKLKPDDYGAHNNLGLAYQNKGEIGKAIKSYQMALRINPYFVNAHSNIGIAYGIKGSLDKAIEHFLTALKIQPYNLKVLLNLGSAYYRSGLFDKAIDQYNTSLQFHPNNTHAHYYLGLVYLKKGLQNKARREFEAALQIDPAHQQARKWLNYITSQDNFHSHK
jgi:tetratricopeptide (TPR) repeat protein